MTFGGDGDDAGAAAMNAAFFGLAVLAALNPKLFAVDLLLIENARPRLMFACFLLGGMGVSLAIGLLDVFVLHADAVKTQGSVSAGLDLALGVPLLAIGVLAPGLRCHAPWASLPNIVGHRTDTMTDWEQRSSRRRSRDLLQPTPFLTVTLPPLSAQASPEVAGPTATTRDTTRRRTRTSGRTASGHLCQRPAGRRCRGGMPVGQSGHRTRADGPTRS
jgi:hypothetical protein